MKFYDVKDEPLKLWGVGFDYTQNLYVRMPEAVAKTVSDSVAHFSKQTSGGRASFGTDSQKLCIRMEYPGFNDNLSHLSLAGTVGVDMYIKTDKGYEYIRTFVPDKNDTEGFEIEHNFEKKEYRKIVLFMPMHNYVSNLCVGIDDLAVINSFIPYRNEKPIVYYGSSITQGICSSRPGNTYPAIISRFIDYDYINLGFSGSAKGENKMAEYIAELSTSLFVCDYDHNSDFENLQKTHYDLYQTFRAAQKNTPVLFITRPDYEREPEQVRLRKKIIYANYISAKKNGDKNVYFLDGTKFFGKNYRHEKTADGIHPNDAGFIAIADITLKKIKEILSL